jgi:hypothetical protein
MSDAANEIAAIAAEIAARKEAAAPSASKVQAPAFVHISGLPETFYDRLVGRDRELARLDEAWRGKTTNILSIVAEGGTGKSALVNEWLERMRAENYRGADAVLGWSFYSQGSKERASSADQFLNWALEKLGIKLETTSASDRGKKIADALAKRRALLLLDGVEPLQHGPGPRVGRLKDSGLCTLLRHFSASPPGSLHGLIVVTSRLAIADIARWKNSAPMIDIQQLSDEAGAALLRDNGVWGTDTQLKAAAQDFAGHPLALSLLASFLKGTQFGDVRRRDHIRGLLNDADNPGHDHARRVMESYQKDWLKDQLELLPIMHMVGLFDRPASGDCLRVLRKKPAIKGLTDKVADLTTDEWNRAVARLRDVRLLSPVDRSAPEALDAHPLVREWFGERLREKSEVAWRAAHSRLYDHLRKTKEGKQPTLKQLAPLYQAIAHGCAAGRYQEALHNVYINRICRRRDETLEFYAIKKLGAPASDLVALRWFFDRPYETPAILAGIDRQWVLGQAAMLLRSQGRFTETLSALHTLSDRATRVTDRRDAEIAINLSEVELAVGEVDAAIDWAKRAVTHADYSRENKEIVISRTTHANALHAAGRRSEAEALFADAAQRCRKWQEGFGFIWFLPYQGYCYCDLLLGKGFWETARDRAMQTLDWAARSNWRLAIAFDELALGRAHHGLALATSKASLTPAAQHPGVCAAHDHLNEAIHALRASDELVEVPRGLLARAAFWRSIGDWEGAARDLEEGQEVAAPVPMKLLLCDMAIERARLAFGQIEAFAPLNGLLEIDNPLRPAILSSEQIARLKEEAAEQLRIAGDYITSCGYHRRDEELAELGAVLRGSILFASLPPRV